jgi:thioredoxin-related protein
MMRRTWKNRTIGIAGLLICLLAFQPLSAQVQWQNWETAAELQAATRRPILLFIYTDWCALCKRTTAESWQNPALADFVNEHFIPVLFNAESTAPVTYQGHTYNYVRKNGLGYHELAAHLLEGRLCFPNITFLGPGQEFLQSFTGYQSPAQMERLLTYYGQGHYREIPWTTYEREYQLQITAEEE